MYDDLSKALHRVSVVELKARHLVESWLKWKDVAEFSSFAYHAALLLANSDLWSVETASIVCDLLCNENDRFRQRAEVVFRSKNDDDIRTSSKLGIDALLTLMKKRAHFQVTSASAKLTLGRLLGNLTLDSQYHLEILLWLERYRIHALTDREYSFNQPKTRINSYITSYFSTDSLLDTCPCVNVCKMSGDLIIYMCDMIGCNFFSFMDIDGDSTSNTVFRKSYSVCCFRTRYLR